MKVVFICGGTSRRMQPLSEDKFLYDFLGRTLLEHQVSMAQKAGIDRFVIIANPANVHRIEEVIFPMPSVSFEIAVQPEPLGIGDALVKASRYLNEEIVIINPNDIFDMSAYERLSSERTEKGIKSHIFGYQVDDYFPGGYLVTTKTGYLSQIIEKPGKGKQPSNMVNVLVHRHSDPKMLLSYITNAKSADDDIYEKALSSMVADGHLIRVLPLPGLWNAIKYPWHILEVTRRFLARIDHFIAPSARISDTAVIEGLVIISDNVTVMEHATVRGPVYIGPGSIIGTGSLVRDNSHIGTGCNVGFNTEIKSSYIGNGNNFHMNYIGDSIVGDNCNFGAGTKLANYRFDEAPVKVKIGDSVIDTGLTKLGAIIGDNCRFGINASIMPGIKIAPNSNIDPHSNIGRDIETDIVIEFKNAISAGGK